MNKIGGGVMKRFLFTLFSIALTSVIFAPATFAAEEGMIDTGDTTWIIVAMGLVLFMHVPGLALFYGGLVSERNVVSTVMHSFVSLIIVSIVWVLWGYTLSYGTSIGGFIGGLDYLGMKGVDGAAYDGLTIPHYLFAALQIVYVAITVAIISGGISGRISFKAWIPFCVLWPTLVYAPMAHAVWGGGWLAQMGELDFAGGTVVHITSGVAALVAALIIGPRKRRDSEKPHNIVLFLFGAATLWFGWFGFNGGSALASGSLTTLAILNTHVAGAAGGLGWLVIEWVLTKRPTLVGTATGAIAGLVAITPGAGFVTIPSSLIIGFLGAPVAYFSIKFVKEKFKYDDTLDAFGVHGMAGIWGAVATGLFATTSVNEAGANGLFYGNAEQILHQLTGVGVSIALTIVGTYIVLKFISIFTPLRVSEEEEITGLDISTHNEPAYNKNYDDEEMTPSFMKS